MNDAIAHLLSRYRHVVEQDKNPSAELVANFNTLRLADAALDKLQLNDGSGNQPAHLVVLGPTQAGKSTLCNLLLDANRAGISALAGYTVHAQGFAVGCSAESLTDVDTLMQPMRRVTVDELQSDQLDQFVLQQIEAGPQAMLDNAVVWDSPDFDSIESSGYRGAVLQSAAVADAIVLMLSKDKYADKTVWDMLGLVRTLGKPLLVCINKLDVAASQTVLDSFGKRHQEQFNSPAPPIVTLPFVRTEQGANAKATRDSGISDDTINISDATRVALKKEVDAALKAINRENQRGDTEQFVRDHWDAWMAPVNAEREALEQWKKLVSESVIDAQKLYAERYLDNPSKYDTFNRAIAELLTLLEIPGIASGLAVTRQVVTWPVRKLLGFGKSAINRDSPPADQELEVLNLTLTQTLMRLQQHVLDEQQDNDENGPIWLAIGNSLRQSESSISEHFDNTAEQLQSDFEPLVDEAAHALYAQLKQQPALLNTLRAARVTTDAAAVVLAVKSGGLAAADLVIAPAMLSITTLLTESALGQYMEHSKRQLKKQQQILVNEKLFIDALEKPLLALTESLADNNLFMVDKDIAL